MTRYVLADVQQAGDELARRAAELTGWLDRVAVEYRPPPEPGPAGAELGLVELSCVQAVSAAATRLSAAAGTIGVCLDELRAADRELGLRLCRWVR